MPKLIVVNAAGASQRRLVSEALEEMKAKGFALSSRQEGGDWVSLFGNSRTAGLFETRTLIQVEDAVLLGKIPQELAGFVEGEDAASALLLIYAGDASKFFPKELFRTLDLRKAREIPRWAGQRQRWIAEEAARLGVKVTSEAAVLLAEWIEDGEELCSELEKLASVAPAGGIDGAMVRQLTVDEGGKDLLNLLDGLCYGKRSQVIHSLESLRRSGVFLKVVVSLHNRFRLAMYQTSGTDGEGRAFAEALGAKPYQSRMAVEAARHYRPEALRAFVAGLIRLSLAEKTGQGQGWHGLCREVLSLMGAAR